MADEKKGRSAKTTAGIWGVITGVVGMAAAKTILDFARPTATDNLTWAAVTGLATGLVIGSLTGSGVLGINIYKGMFTTDRTKI